MKAPTEEHDDWPEDCSGRQDQEKTNGRGWYDGRKPEPDEGTHEVTWPRHRDWRGPLPGPELRLGNGKTKDLEGESRPLPLTNPAGNKLRGNVRRLERKQDYKHAGNNGRNIHRVWHAPQWMFVCVRACLLACTPRTTLGTQRARSRPASRPGLIQFTDYSLGSKHTMPVYFICIC